VYNGNARLCTQDCYEFFWNVLLEVENTLLWVIHWIQTNLAINIKRNAQGTGLYSLGKDQGATTGPWVNVQPLGCGNGFLLVDFLLIGNDEMRITREEFFACYVQYQVLRRRRSHSTGPTWILPCRRYILQRHRRAIRLCALEEGFVGLMLW